MSLPEPYYQDETTTLWHARAEEVLPTLPDKSVQLVLTDVPYFRVKLDEAWDKQWKIEAAYLDWIRWLCTEWQRVLTPNGSLYCFASPVMAWAVEGVIREHFCFLNRITWLKDDGWHKKTEKEETRSYLSPWEAILFAEQRGSDVYASGEAGFVEAETLLKKRLFGGPILEGMQGTKTSAQALTAAIGAHGAVNHGGAVSNWLNGFNLPSKEQYEGMRQYLNSLNGREYLRQEYEELRQEYEELRRPFSLTAQDQYTDVWTFAPEKPAPGKHPCCKPLPLLRHIITTSSRPGDVVLDTCCGEGSTLEAAKQCGRRSLGIEMELKWCKRAARRVSQDVIPGLFGKVAPNGHTPIQESLPCP